MMDLQVGAAFEKRSVPLPDLSRMQVLPDMYQVKAKIEPQYRWRLMDEFGAECFTQQSDGSLLFSFGFADKESIVHWIVSFGDGAQLLEPAQLRKDVFTFAKEICRKYQFTDEES